MTAESPDRTSRRGRREAFNAPDHSPDMSTDLREKTSTDVVLAIAEELDADPINLEPLSKSIDPGAIDRLFGPEGGGDAELSFSHAGVHVRIDSGGVHVL